MDTSSSTPASSSTATTTGGSAPHQHTSACWWDHHHATWTCTSPAPESAPERPLVDVRDMLVVHTALLREFRLAPAAVRRVPAGDRRHAARVDRHLGLLCDLLHHHHHGEDELLWPPLRARLPRQGQQLLDDAEAQHAALDAALTRVGTARTPWARHPDPTTAQDLTTALATLHTQLAAHLDDEERTLLPLAASHLTPTEWKAVGEAGGASVPKTAMALVFGMFAYEGDPDVITSMLAEAPAPLRTFIPALAPRAYARRATQIHGTPRP